MLLLQGILSLYIYITVDIRYIYYLVYHAHVQTRFGFFFTLIKLNGYDFKCINVHTTYLLWYIKFTCYMHSVSLPTVRMVCIRNKYMVHYSMGIYENDMLTCVRKLELKRQVLI